MRFLENRFPVLALALALAIGTSCAKASDRKRNCEAETTAFAGWLRALHDEGVGGTVWGAVRGVKLPRGASTKRAEPAPMLRVGERLVSISNMVVADAKRIMKNDDRWQVEFRAALRKELQRSHPEAKALQMQVDARTTWRVIRKLVAEARATGVEAVTFLFRKPTAVPPPPPSKLDAIIEQTQRNIDSGKARLGAPPVAALDVYRACSHTRAAAERLAKSNRQLDREPITLGHAVAKCGCTIDLAAAKAVQWWRSGRRTKHPEVTVGIRMRLVAKQSGAPKPIAAPDLAPWSETYKRVLATAGTGRAFVLVAKK